MELYRQKEMNRIESKNQQITNNILTHLATIMEAPLGAWARTTSPSTLFASTLLPMFFTKFIIRDTCGKKERVNSYVEGVE